MSLDDIRQTTKCPFASSSRAISVDMTTRSPLAERQLANSARILTVLCADIERSPWDVFSYHIENRSGRTLSEEARLLKWILTGLAARDPVDSRDLLTEDIAAPQWRFRYHGSPLFVAVFSSCYPPSHRRHSPDSTSYVLLQPESSFHRIPRARRGAVRESTKEAFARAGQHYWQDDAEAERYLPHPTGFDGVSWWEL